MLDVKEAVKIAFDYFNKLYESEIKDFREILVEEVELTEDNLIWKVTLGFSKPKLETGKITSPIANAIGIYDNSKYARYFKEFKIEANSGEVKSMKIRSV